MVRAGGGEEAMSKNRKSDEPAPDENVANPTAAADQLGVCCPKCGCRHVPARYTRRYGKRTYRMRRCRNCDWGFRTMEQLAVG